MLRILRRVDWILCGLLTKRLAQSRSRLHARLSHSEIVLRGIPNEFEEAIIFGFVVDDDGRFVNLAADADDVATHNRRRVASRDCLGARVTLISAYGSSCSCWRICARARSGRSL